MSTQNRPSAEFLRIAALKPRQVEALVLRGETPGIETLPGWEYKGLNLGPVARLLGIQKFVKGFYRASDVEVFGYNRRARQNGPTAPWVAKLSKGQPRPFGFYSVTPVDPESRDNAYLRAALLDYGRGDNGRFDITAALRDYLVRANTGSDDLLLGKAFIAAGPLRLPVGYFLLERYRTVIYSR